MEQNINISEILKDKPVGLKFYSNTFGYISFNGVHKDKVYFFSEDTNAHSVKPNGKMYDGGECIIFPSKEMRDWEKFSWKKGDVLVMDGFRVVFDKWVGDDYTRFNAVHLITSSGVYFNKPSQNRYSPISHFITKYWRKMTDAETKIYMNSLEIECGGKLNLATLAIEKQPEFKDGDIVALVVRKCTHIAIFQSRQETYIGFHAVLCNNEQLLLEEPCREDDGDLELRPATDSEKQQLFDALAKENKAWDSDKKQIVGLKPTFEVGKLYVFREEDEDGELTIIGELIAKNESEDTLTFGNQYEIETEKFVTDQAFDLRISVNKELREATENEVELFNKHYAIWREQPDFKTFDKVLVSIGSGFKWRPALFIRDHGENCTNRYNVLPLYSGKPADFEHCIPYEGNENIAFADYNSEDLPLPF